ncbi:hypothetical protein [Mesorhizobium sp. BHbdii]
MVIFGNSRVASDEIDALGHMNIRRYTQRALLANQSLMENLGLSEEGRSVEVDVYARYHREQFQGAELSVAGGVLTVEQDQVRAYYEIQNTIKAEVATCFIITTAVVGPEDGGRIGLHSEVTRRASALRVDLPDHGRPRTIDLFPVRLDLTLEQITRRLADSAGDLTKPALEWSLDADLCNEHGFLVGFGALTFGVWRSPREELSGRPGPREVPPLSDGRRVGWASLEMRTVQAAPLRAGDRLYSIGGEINLQRKVRHSRRGCSTSGRASLSE